MAKRKSNSPEVGDRYRAADKQFTITGLPIMYEDQWVEYTDAQNKKDYYCRLEAFLDRFTLLDD